MKSLILLLFVFVSCNQSKYKTDPKTGGKIIWENSGREIDGGTVLWEQTVELPDDYVFEKDTLPPIWTDAIGIISDDSLKKILHKKKDTVFIKNMKDYKDGYINVLVSPSGRKSVVTEVDARNDWISGDGPEGVNPYIETLIFDSSVVILCLYERRVGKEMCIDTLAIDYYRKAVFFNSRNYNPIITKADKEFQKIIARKLNEKE